MQPAEVMSYVLQYEWNAKLESVHRKARFTHLTCRNAGTEFGLRKFSCTSTYKGRIVRFTILGDGEIMSWSGPQ